MQRRHSSRCRRSRGLTQCRPDSFPEVACATEGRIAGKKARTAITSSGAITPVMCQDTEGRSLAGSCPTWPACGIGKRETFGLRQRFRLPHLMDANEGQMIQTSRTLLPFSLKNPE